MCDDDESVRHHLLAHENGGPQRDEGGEGRGHVFVSPRELLLGEVEHVLKFKFAAK